MTLFRHLVLLLLLAGPISAREVCDFKFEIDSQSSAFQALVDGAAARGGFWRPIREAPDDVQDMGRYVGRLDICLVTADGKPRDVHTAHGTVTLQSPHVTSCTAALLPGNRLLTNRHCFFEPSLVAAGFDRVREARVNFGYVSRDFTGDVQSFPVDRRALAEDRATDALLLQISAGDANGALGGHVPMVMARAAAPRSALTMIHHPRGAPQQFSSGTCQVHPAQADLPAGASQLRHSCESAGGSSGALLLDARTLAVVGLHNQGGLSARGGYNAGHRIAAVEAALSLGFRTPDAGRPPVPAAKPAAMTPADAQAALLAAAALEDEAARRKALETLILDFRGTEVARSAGRMLTAMAPDLAIPDRDADAAIIAAMKIVDVTAQRIALETIRRRFPGSHAAQAAEYMLSTMSPPAHAPDPAAVDGRLTVLGMTVAELTPDLRRLFDQGRDAQGLLILKVERGSTMEDRGVRVGDLIVSIGADAPVARTIGDLSRAVARAETSDGVTLFLILAPGDGGPRKHLRIALARDGALRKPSIDPKRVLGLSLARLTPELHRRFNLSRYLTRGALVLSVNPDSEAYRKGVRKGGLITVANLQRVDDPEGFVGIVDSLQGAGVDRMPVLIRNMGRPLAIELSLGR